MEPSSPSASSWDTVNNSGCGRSERGEDEKCDARQTSFNALLLNIEGKKTSERHELFCSSSWEDKLKVQRCYPPPLDESNCRQLSLPEHLPHETLIEETSVVQKKKVASARHAVNEVNKKFGVSNISDDDDADDDESCMSLFSCDGSPYCPCHVCQRSKRRKTENSQLEDFLLSLPYCLFFDTSFRVRWPRVEDSKLCWCPCGKYMEPWQMFFGLNGTEEVKKAANVCGTNGPKGKEPEALLDHLKTQGKNCPFHFGVSQYLEEFYKDFNGPRLGHKAIYKNRDDNLYKKATSAENMKNQKLFTEMQKALFASQKREESMCRYNKEFQKKMESLGEVNEEQRQKLVNMDLLFKKLGLEREEDDVDITERDYESFRLIFQNSVDVIKAKSPKAKKKAIKFSVENNFSLQKLLDDLDQQDKDNSFLLRDLKFRNNRHHHAPKLITDWIVEFGEATDEGGPSKHFFSEVWSQLETLKVRASDFEVKLFEISSVGASPNSNEILRCSGRKGIDPKIVDSVVGKAKRYYRAIGRIMFHSLVRGFVLSSTAMPSFYRNVIFRDCNLQDCRYKHAKIIKDLDAMTGNMYDQYKSVVVDERMELNMFGFESDEKVTNENFITKVLHEIFITQRSIAITSLKEGITLDGYADMTVSLRTMPEKAISDILFAPPNTHVADVFKVLKPKYTKDGTEEENQKVFFKEVFKTVITENAKKDDLFLSTFLSFVTGLTFLPHSLARPGYEISVEFCGDIVDTKARPQSKTCVNALILPSHAYNRDKEIFDEVLTNSLLEMKEHNFTDD